MHTHKEDRLPKQKTEQNTLGGKERQWDLQFTEQKEMCARSCGVLGGKRREGVGRCAAVAEAYIQNINESIQRDNTNKQTNKALAVH